MIPKFRVFAKAGVEAVFGGGYDTGQMFYEINYIDFYDKEVSVWGCHNKDCGTCDDTYKMEDVEVMMSTGMKDKDGTEIYEGDIIECFHELAVVKKAEVGFDVFATDGYKYKTVYRGHIKVLGSIYENPELLDAKPYLNESGEL